MIIVIKLIVSKPGAYIFAIVIFFCLNYFLRIT